MSFRPLFRVLMNAFLRFLGYSESEAASILRTLRETTLNGLHAHHREWAEHFVPPAGAAQDP